MKNAFYFIWKALFVVKIIKCLSWLIAEEIVWLETQKTLKILKALKFIRSKPG